MDEARASCAIDISGRPFLVFEGSYPDARVADFDTDLAEEFLRAVASTAKLTLHLRVEAGANSHHMVEASFKAFARALRAAVSDDPRRDRRALHRRASCERREWRSSTTAWATSARWPRRSSTWAHSRS